MTSIEKKLIQIVGDSLYPSEKSTIKEEGLSKDEIVKLFVEAQKQSVFPIVFDKLKERLKIVLEDDLFNEYQIQDSKHRAATIRNINDHIVLHGILSKRRIPYVILKGQVSASYYHKLELRSCGDVDFLIKKADVSRVDRILVKEGFRKREDAEKHDFHWAYTKEKTVLELHWNIPGVPKNDKKISAIMSTVFADAVTYENQIGCFRGPSKLHHGMILLLHTLSHLTSTGIGLRHLCDWLVFEESLTDEEFLSLFEKKLCEVGLWKFAQVLTQIGTLYFGCKEHSWCKEIEPALCSGILEDILSGGNFGVKSNTRQLEAKIMRNSRTRKIKKGSTFKNLIININEKAKRKVPISKKIIILRPIGWIGVVIEYGVWVHKRKLKHLDLKIFKEAERRADLYSELHLFEKTKFID